VSAKGCEAFVEAGVRLDSLLPLPLYALKGKGGGEGSVARGGLKFLDF